MKGTETRALRVAANLKVLLYKRYAPGTPKTTQIAVETKACQMVNQRIGQTLETCAPKPKESPSANTRRTGQ